MTGYKIITLSTGPTQIEQYEAFIISTFLRAIRDSSRFIRKIDPKKYYFNYSNLIKNTLDNIGGEVRVAVLSDEVDTALGWSLSFGDTLLFMFVKKDYRNIGIGNSLLPPGVKRKQRKGTLQ